MHGYSIHLLLLFSFICYFTDNKLYVKDKNLLICKLFLRCNTKILLPTLTAVVGVGFFLPPFVCESVCFSARYLKIRCS